MTKTPLSIALLLCLCGLSFGFSGCYSGHPKDLPRLYSCSVRITQESQPLSGAIVMFHSEESGQKWFPMAQTNERGIAEMRTNALYSGVPAGRYRVSVRKIDWDTSSLGKKPAEGTPEYQKWETKIASGDLPSIALVDKQYSVPETSPLTVEVKKQRNNRVDLDVGKAVRIKL